MEHATRVLSPVLGKLSSLLAKEYSKLKGVRDEIRFLKEELSSMHVFLEKLADVDDLDIQIKQWRNQVLDLSYDIEDCIDDFMLRVDHGSDVKKGFFQKSIQKLKTLGARNDIAEQIVKLKARVGDVSERRTRYNFDKTISNSGGVVPIDPRLTALYTDVKRLVGMDGPKDEIIKLLTEGEGELVQKLRVVSIWGFGGLGKTTLANQVYHQLKNQFDCKAFVSVSQKPDLITLLTKILSEVTGKQSIPTDEVVDPIDKLRWFKILSEVTGKQSIPTDEVVDLIDKLRNHLLDKRYFIIIDDLWDESTWRFVRYAFPENSNGSRVITTTRIEPLAKACCDYQLGYIYKMRFLNDQDSRRLFFHRIFGSEDACPPRYKEDSAKILKKCGGLPLAIITVASILAIQTTEPKMHWEYVCTSLGTISGANLSLEGTRQILNLSYINLPHYLRTCFLYFGIYPEDYSIGKDDLIGRWIAEGFVSEVHGVDVEDVVESYFNELANRSMIQLEETYIDCAEVLTCRIHDMMLDLITDKLRDNNFIATIGDSDDMMSCYRACILSLHSGYSKQGMIPVTTNGSQVRSLAIFRGSKDYIHMLPFSDFKHIRVLNLQFAETSRRMTIDLTGMSTLFHLRHFKVKLIDCLDLRLPSQIRGLRHLETFEIDTGGRPPQCDVVIPSDIVHLPRLLHLIVPFKKELLEGIGNMKSLRTLQCYGFYKISLENFQGIAELTNLRSLRIISSFVDAKEYVDFFSCSLGKIADCKLKYLFIGSYEGRSVCCDGLSCLPLSQHRLRTLKFWCWWFSRVPKWIGQLHNLNTLMLEVRELLKDGVRILAQLSVLVELTLFVRRAPEERIVIGATTFPVLKYFTFTSRRMRLVFEAGAMPKLQLLALYSRLREGEQHIPHLVGIEHLSSLKQINTSISGYSVEESRRRIESALRNAIHMHPSHPRLVIINFVWAWRHYFDEEDEENRVNLNMDGGD